MGAEKHEPEMKAQMAGRVAKTPDEALEDATAQAQWMRNGIEQQIAYYYGLGDLDELSTDARTVVENDALSLCLYYSRKMQEAKAHSWAEQDRWICGNGLAGYLRLWYDAERDISALYNFGARVGRG